MTIAAFLAADELDLLADVRAGLGSPTASEQAEVQTVVEAWTDIQAVANVLFYPEVLPPEKRLAALRRGLSDQGHRYLRLAAATGAGSLDLGSLGDDDRLMLLRDLRGLLASDTSTVAARASVSIRRLLLPADSADIVPLLAHPDRVVRRNLEIALLGLLGPRALQTLLADRSRVAGGDAAAAHAAFAGDGIDATRELDQQRVLPSLVYLPNLSEWS